MDMLKNGTHVLVTDIDNIFNRYVPLHGFLEEGFDVYHAYEMKFPTHIYFKTRFVVCGGHSFFRASPETIRYMEIVLNDCASDKCNDQITLNSVLFNSLDVKWDNGNPNHARALRMNTTGDYGSSLEKQTNKAVNNYLLVESATGRSRVTNHLIKIWDRHFAWRVSNSKLFVGICVFGYRCLGLTCRSRFVWHMQDSYDSLCINPRPISFAFIAVVHSWPEQYQSTAHPRTIGFQCQPN